MTLHQTNEQATQLHCQKHHPKRHKTISELQTQIREIEGASFGNKNPTDNSCTLDAPLELRSSDGKSFGRIIKAPGLHTITPSTPQHKWAAITFGFATTAQDFNNMARDEKRKATHKNYTPLASENPAILVCWERQIVQELGRFHQTGLTHFGFKQDQVMFAETTALSDTLWVVEQALQKARFSRILIISPPLELHQLRRLSLIAKTKESSLIFVSMGKSRSYALESNWSVRNTHSSMNPWDEKSPGGMSWLVSLERLNKRYIEKTWTVELCSASFRLHLASDLVDREPQKNISNDLRDDEAIRIIRGATWKKNTLRSQSQSSRIKSLRWSVAV